MNPNTIINSSLYTVSGAYEPPKVVKEHATRYHHNYQMAQIMQRLHGLYEEGEVEHTSGVRPGFLDSQLVGR